MKKYILAFSVALLSFSCSNQYNQAMLSTDKEEILKVAKNMFANKKWKESLDLYERVQNLVSGTEEASDVLYNSAYANYYSKNYRLAGHQFKRFFNSNVLATDPRREEAAYMSAMCYYEGSLEYDLDQSNTTLAINELQNFVNVYPNSDKTKKVLEKIDELTDRLELKAFENARQYYQILEYKAAVIAFENMLSDYPSTKLKSKIDEYMMLSKMNLALNSKPTLKKERLESAIAYAKAVEKNYEGKNLSKQAMNIRLKLEREFQHFTK